MAANDAVSMNVAENRQNVPMAIQENRAAVPMTVAEGGGTPGGLNRKADKVVGAVAGNLAGLDANGNLTDSGKAPGDFLEAPATSGSEGQVLTADGEGGASWQDPTGGDPTEIIDDTAGDGDTDKVWSADKSHALLTEINSKADKTVTDALQKDKAPVIIDHAEGNPIVLTDGADGLPIKGMKIHFSPIQSGTGDPSPENIRPISGWTGVTAWRMGVNVWDEEWELGTFNSQGQPSVSNTSIRCKNFIPVVPGETYKYINSTGSSQAPWLYDINKEFISHYGSYMANGATITIPDGVYYIKFALPGTYGDTYKNDVAWNYPSTETEYHAYTGQSYPVTFPDGQTIYGGTLDAVNDVLTVDRVMVDLGTLSYIYRAATDTKPIQRFAASITNGKDGLPLTEICSCYKTDRSPVYSGGTDYSMCLYNSSVYILDSRYTSASDFKAAMSGVQLVYELATPIEIPLDPITVQTLLGDNTIWSDANGTIELDYRADTKLFIAKNKQDIRATIAPIEDGAKASQAYSAGKFFYHDGQFCKAKTSIAAGATFTLNTNYQITTVADELFALN